MIRSASIGTALALILGACSSGTAPAATGSLAPTASANAPAPTATPGPTRRPLRVLMLGDSILIPSMGCGDCLGADRRYADLLQTRTGREVILDNEARPNAQIKDLQALLDQDAGIQADVAAADIVVVSIGYNNGPNWDPADPCHAPEGHTIAEGLRITIDYLKDACVADTLAMFETKLDTLYGRIEQLAAGRPQVRISLGVYANLDGNVGLDDDGTISSVPAEELAQAIDVYNRIIDKWNVIDCEAATAHRFVCGDIHHLFNGPTGNDRIEALVNPDDYVHPNIAGQVLIATLLGGIDVSAVTN